MSGEKCRNQSARPETFRSSNEETTVLLTHGTLEEVTEAKAAPDPDTTEG